jgi:hypothetical protein
MGILYETQPQGSQFQLLETTLPPEVLAAAS